MHGEALRANSTLILGSATGETLEYMALRGFRSQGIEISDWATSQLSEELKEKTHKGNIAKVFPKLLDQGFRYDFVFSQSLMYLPLEDIKIILDGLKKSTFYFSHFGGFEELKEPNDNLVITQESFSWWENLFSDYGFKKQFSPYFWVNTAFA